MPSAMARCSGMGRRFSMSDAPQKKGRPGGTAPAHAMGCMKGSALLAILIVAAFLLAAALLATLFILLVLLVGLAGLTALLTGILVLVCHLTLS